MEMNVDDLQPLVPTPLATQDGLHRRSESGHDAENGVPEVDATHQFDMEEKGDQHGSSIRFRTFGQLFRLNIAWAGINFIWFLMGVVLLPAQIATVSTEQSKGTRLGLILMLGSLATILGSPIIGVMSDSLQSYHNRRHPFMAYGSIGTAIGFIGLAYSVPNLRDKSQIGDNAAAIQNDNAAYLFIGFFYFVTVLAYNFMSVPYNGLLADATHFEARGLSSGLMGGLQMLGTIVAAGTGVSVISLGVPLTYSLMAAIFITSTAFTIRSTARIPSKGNGNNSGGCMHPVTAIGHFIEPFTKSADFCWIFTTRLLNQMGVATVQFFMQYWMEDAVDLPDGLSPSAAASVAFVPLLVVAMFSSTASGWISDRTGGRRKVIVCVSGLIMAAGTFCAIFVSDFYAGLVIMAGIGSGYGAFLAVDFAMAVDVVGHRAESGRDLAVWHLSLVLPQTIATPIGGVIRDYFQHVGCATECNLGYRILFAITTTYFIIASSLIFKIKGIK
eukprot:Clim_evm4s65 gene=Clim_evmTU4s65